MRYRCSSCGQVTESPVELGEQQLAVQACIACGAIGSTTYWPEADVRWWIGIRGERHGPYVVAQLQGLIRAGKLSANAYVWGPGFSSWARAGTLPEFAGLFAPPPAPPPVTVKVAAVAEEAGSTSAAAAETAGPSDAAVARDPVASETATTPETAAAATSGPAEPDASTSAPSGLATPGPSAPLAEPPTSLTIDSPLPEATQAPEVVASETDAALAAPAPAAPALPGTPTKRPAVAPSVPSSGSAPGSSVMADAAPIPAAPAAPSALSAPGPVGPPPLPERRGPTGPEGAATSGGVQAPQERVPRGPTAPPPIPLRSARVALDDVRRPPPTRFGLPVVVPVQAEVSGPALTPDAAAAPAPRSPSDASEAGETRGKGLTRLTAASLPAPDRADAGARAGSQTILEPVATRESLAVPDDGLGEDFFAGVAPGATSDPEGHHGSLDRDIAELGGLFQNAGPVRVREPSRQEMQALRQEFSVVARLERHKRKRLLTIGLVVGGVVALAVVLAVVVPSRNIWEGGGRTGASESEAFERATYDVPKKPGEASEEDTAATDEGGGEARATGGKARSGGAKKARSYAIGDDQVAGGTSGAMGGDGPAAVGSRETAGALESAASRAARIKSLAAEADSFGKTEVALGFDSREAARKAEEAAAERKSAAAGEQAEKVSAAFAAKLSQFKRCATDTQEKVKVIFTVSIHGKVVSADATGTGDVQKKSCILGILRQAVFPAGDVAQTFGQTLTL